MEQQPWIGRRVELELLEKEIFVRKPNEYHKIHSRSLVGPRGIGKRRLLREATKRFQNSNHSGVFLFRRDFSDSSTLAVLLKDFSLDFQRVITKDVLITSRNSEDFEMKLVQDVQSNYAWFANNRDLIVKDPRSSIVIDRVKEKFIALLSAYTKLGQHIILVIDSFDAAHQSYPPDSVDQSLGSFLYGISGQSSRSLNLSVLLVCERMPRFIIELNGSTWEPAYPPIVLRNFNDEEMDEYFQSFATLPCGVLEEYTKNRILTYAGRFPLFLMELRRRISETDCADQSFIHPQDLLTGQGALYRHLCALMQSQWVDYTSRSSGPHIYAMDVFKRYFISGKRRAIPNSHINQLYEFGLVDRKMDGSYVPLTQYNTELDISNNSLLAYVQSCDPKGPVLIGPSGVKAAWLHMSDLHVFSQPETTLILGHYRELAKHLDPQPQFLVVTGDFRHKARGTNFELAKDFLNEILNVFQLDKKDVFLVPGNHDAGDTSTERAQAIQKIHEASKNGSAYMDYLNSLNHAFWEYDDFVRGFYMHTGVSDVRMATPSCVYNVTWNDSLNILCTNTALISDGDREKHREVLDINALYKIQINTNCPSIMLGHHGIDSLYPKQEELVRAFMEKYQISAYLHGDIHRHRENPIFSLRMNTCTPTYSIACGKSAPQSGDAVSDIGVIYYQWCDDDKVYINAYQWRTDGFHPDTRFEDLDRNKSSFSMQIPHDSKCKRAPNP